MIGSQPEVEWDETEREWVLGLAEYRATLECHIHGGPLSECSGPEKEFAYDVPLPTRCHIATRLRIGQDEYMASGDVKHPEALRWATQVKV